MEQPKQLELNGILPEDIEKKNIVEKFKNNDIDEGILQKIVDEILAERNKDDIIKQGFFWRVAYLYLENTGVKMNEEEIRRFYEKIKLELIKILELKQIKYKSDKMPVKKEGSEKYFGWLDKWEKEQIQ